MKKLSIAALLAVAAVSASAVEVGVTTTTEHIGDWQRQGYGVTVGQQVAGVKVTGGFERFTMKDGEAQDRFSVVAGKDVAKLGPVTITPKLGVAYLNNKTDVDGFALVAGVGASLPLTKDVSLGVDVLRQAGQERVNAYNGTSVKVGVKYNF